MYAVEHDWCAVVRKLLDIAFESQDIDAASAELSVVLQEEVSLLHRAVRKKCRPMVELLLAYVPSILVGTKDADMASFKQKLEFKVKWSAIFKPDMWGPAGMTPLHVAASIQDAEEVVDALTSDPCQVSDTVSEKRSDFGPGSVITAYCSRQLNDSNLDAILSTVDGYSFWACDFSLGSHMKLRFVHVKWFLYFLLKYKIIEYYN